MLPGGDESSSVVLLEAKILLREDWVGRDIGDACSYIVLWTLGRMGGGSFAVRGSSANGL